MEIDPERFIKSPFLIGLAGAIVSLRWAPGISWLERLFTAASGSMMAGFFSPAVSQYLKFGSAEMQGATAFAMGLFGLNAAATLLRWLSTLQVGDLLPWKKKD